ncbi:hypothetical protein MMC31_002838 [Peltigera leucophlebia]|nr:hypothetical protein [Peltigera leucophlebia]
MHSTIAKLFAVAAAILTPALADTIHGVAVFTRHGDRTAKLYKYHTTNLGYSQVRDVGAFYRNRYVKKNADHQILGISPDQYQESQLWVSAPDQTIHLESGYNFFEGLYPPLESLDMVLANQKLNNGSDSFAPLNGYQIVHLHGEAPEAPDTIWIKGDDGCPALTSAATMYEQSSEYLSTLDSSRGFYQQFTEILANNLPAANVTYKNAFTIFDLLNVANIHNASVNVPSDKLDQLRYYSDASEFGRAYNRTMPDRAIGGMTLIGGLLQQLNQTISSKGQQKLSLFFGSYMTFFAFFGLTNLTDFSPDFKGCPNYASSIAFELYTEQNMTTFPSNTNDLRVRFLFKNGTDGSLSEVPLFGRKETTLSWADFNTESNARAIKSASVWCARCKTSAGFCSQRGIAPDSTFASATTSATPMATCDKPKLTLAQAGVIGAMTTLGLAALAAAAIFFFVRRGQKTGPAASPTKRTVDSDSESGNGSKAA